MRIVKTTLGLLALLAFATPAPAQDLKAKLEKKKSEKWFTFVNWTADYDEARKTAKSSGKYIFGYFTRSYAY